MMESSAIASSRFGIFSRHGRLVATWHETAMVAAQTKGSSRCDNAIWCLRHERR